MPSLPCQSARRPCEDWARSHWLLWGRVIGPSFVQATAVALACGRVSAACVDLGRPALWYFVAHSPWGVAASWAVLVGVSVRDVPRLCGLCLARLRGSTGYVLSTRCLWVLPSCEWLPCGMVWRLGALFLATRLVLVIRWFNGAGVR